jgi:outer membrane murein-binding lipoprotein Lpp
MRRRIFPLILIAFLTLTLITVVPTYGAHHEKPIVVAHSKGALEPDTQLLHIMNISYIDWRFVTEELSSSDLDGATMLIMSKSDSALEYSSAELSAINGWLDEGGKTIWVAADSDYGTDEMRIPTANQVLESIGSKLRIDHASAEDAVSNGGAPYRVLGVSSNVDPEMEFLVRGVTRGLFHGPGLVASYVDGEWVDLMENKVETVYVVMTTSDTGIVVDNQEPAPNVMTPGAEGNFPLMAIETDMEKMNIMIATGESPFDQYVGLYKPEIIRMDRYGPEANPQQGQYLFENILKFATIFSPDWFEMKIELQSLNSEISDYKETVTSLEADIDELESQVSDYESEVSGLESQVSDLESQVEQAQSSASTMQLLAVAALVIGVVIGYFVGPMIKK